MQVLALVNVGSAAGTVALCPSYVMCIVRDTDKKPKGGCCPGLRQGPRLGSPRKPAWCVLKNIVLECV